VIDSSGPSADLKGVRGRQHLAHLAANLCEFEKEQAAPTVNGGFGYHPVLAFLDNTNEALAGILRPGNAGANTAGDHITVTAWRWRRSPTPDAMGSRS
jgi:hypothetical protein